ncbi:MAG: rod shape-determining protein MreD [Prevotella sp.]|jgi:rod shape-determining protein MreD
MNIDFLRRLLLFVVLLLVQVLVLNHIHLFDYATPLLYVYFVISFRRNYPKWGILIWSFLMGLSIDIFSNTPGMAAASMTMIAMLQPSVMELLVLRDSDEDLQPSISALSFSRYLYYVIILTLTYCLLFFTIESFDFFNWKEWGFNILGSTALTVTLIMVVDNLRGSK